MSLFSTSKKKTPVGSRETFRPHVLVTLKVEQVNGLPLDPGSAWELLQEMFEKHESLILSQAEVRPLLPEESTSIHGK